MKRTNKIKAKRFYLHVFIIESPLADDFLTKRYEGELLHKFLTWRGIKSHHYFAIDKNSFQQAIGNLVREALGEEFKRIGLSILDNKPIPIVLPIIHISAHGNEEGIGLTNGELVTWKELGNLLSPLNKAFQGIILSISACEGWSAIKMLFESKDLPFNVLISNKGKPTWEQTLIGFTIIYHRLKEELDFLKAINAAKEATGNNDFVYLSIPEIEEFIQKLFDELVKYFMNLIRRE